MYKQRLTDEEKKFAAVVLEAYEAECEANSWIQTSAEKAKSLAPNYRQKLNNWIAARILRRQQKMVL